MKRILAWLLVVAGCSPAVQPAASPPSLTHGHAVTTADTAKANVLEAASSARADAFVLMEFT